MAIQGKYAGAVHGRDRGNLAGRLCPCAGPPPHHKLFMNLSQHRMQQIYDFHLAPRCYLEDLRNYTCARIREPEEDHEVQLVGDY